MTLGLRTSIVHSNILNRVYYEECWFQLLHHFLTRIILKTLFNSVKISSVHTTVVWPEVQRIFIFIQNKQYFNIFHKLWMRIEFVMMGLTYFDKICVSIKLHSKRKSQGSQRKKSNVGSSCKSKYHRSQEKASTTVRGLRFLAITDTITSWKIRSYNR